MLLALLLSVPVGAFLGTAARGNIEKRNRSRYAARRNGAAPPRRTSSTSKGSKPCNSCR